MSTRVVLIPGFNVKDGGRATVGQLVPFIEGAGWEVDEDEGVYGYWNLWKIVFFNGKARQDVLMRLVEAIKKADIIIGHSNGMNFGMQALAILGTDYYESKVCIWISGACNSNMPVPLAVKKMLVLYTPWDIWVRLASYIPFNTWGRCGAIGYTGDDVRVISVKETKIHRHSNWFVKRFIRITWDYIHEFGMKYATINNSNKKE